MVSTESGAASLMAVLISLSLGRTSIGAFSMYATTFLADFMGSFKWGPG